MVQGWGQSVQGLASPEVQGAVDTVIQAGQNGVANLIDLTGRGLDAVGIQNGLQDEARPTLEATANNPIVQGVQNRLEEYRNDPEFAISRDLTRGAFEIGSLLVGPELLVGKTGAALRAGRAAEEGLNAMRVAEDAARLTREIPRPPLGIRPGDPIRARASSDPLLRSNIDDIENYALRSRAARDQHKWEYDSAVARGDEDTAWELHKYSQPETADQMLAAVKDQYRKTTVPDMLDFDGQGIAVYGARNDQELAAVQAQIARMESEFPGTARATDELFLIGNIGRNHGTTREITRGLTEGTPLGRGAWRIGPRPETPNSIILRDRPHTLYHELTHNLDAAEGHWYDRYWSNGQKTFGQEGGDFVTDYARRGGAHEDFAESVAAYLDNPGQFLERAWNGDGSLYEKYLAIRQFQELLRSRVR
jgi:hypothetical protein